MAVLANRVVVDTATTGTGTVTLGAAVSDAFLTFAEAGVQDADVVTYLITEGTDFEMGRGTYTASGTTLSRDTVLDSKIGGTAGTTKMTLAGAAEVRIAAAAEDMFHEGLAAKTTPVDADKLGLLDSAASFILKTLTWANLKATLETYFDTIYVASDGGTALSAKATPVSADGIVGIDSADSDNAKEFPASFFLSPVVTDANAAVSLALTHNRVDLMLTHATPVLTVDAQATTAYVDGMALAVSGANAFTITAAAGVDINGSTASSWTIDPWPGSTVLVRIGSDDWVLRGNATAV